MSDLANCLVSIAFRRILAKLGRDARVSIAADLAFGVSDAKAFTIASAAAGSSKREIPRIASEDNSLSAINRRSSEYKSSGRAKITSCRARPGLRRCRLVINRATQRGRVRALS